MLVGPISKGSEFADSINHRLEYLKKKNVDLH